MTATAPASTSAPPRPSIGTLKGRMRLMLDLCPGLTERERRVGHLMLNNTHGVTYEVSGELVTWLGVPSLAESILFSEEEEGLDPDERLKRLKSIVRSVKRARARLQEVGVLVLVEKGGRGQKSTSRFLFSVPRLDRFERDALRAGILQRFGAGDDEEAVTLSWESDTRATLGADSAGAVQGDMAPQSDAHATLSANGVRQSDRPATQAGAVPVEKARRPVDIPVAAGGGTVVRVTPGGAKGDRGGSGRVTGAPPEPESNQTQPGRVRGGGRTVDRRQREMPLMRTMRGGLAGAVDAAQNAAEAKRDARGDRRHEAVMHRATAVLGGDQRTSSLAVSTLRPEVIDRMRRGWTPSDAEFQALLDESLASLRGAGLIADVPEAGGVDGIAALRGEMRALQEQVGTLARLVETVLRTGGGALAAVG